MARIDRWATGSPASASPIILPSSYEKRVDVTTWDMLSKRGGYDWLVQSVNHHVEKDRNKTNFSVEDAAACGAVQERALEMHTS